MGRRTPGPWTVRQRTGTPHVYTVSGRRDGKGETVCYVKDGEVARKVGNARLIAAAPDLLAEAKAASGALRAHLVNVYRADERARLRARADGLDAAIAKATESEGR